MIIPLSIASIATVLTGISIPGHADEGHDKRAGVAQNVTVTILSSNLANGNSVGEWGLSALVQADGACVLFDAGRHPETVIHNAEVLGADLSCVTDLVLSHHHFDHTTGVLPILEALGNHSSIERVHVARGFFRPRRVPSRSGAEEANQMIEERQSLENAGLEVIIHDGPSEILKGVWVTGPVPRPHSEENYPVQVRIKESGTWVADWVPESQGLTIVTEEGHIVLLGCGHSGVVNMLTHVQSAISDHPIHALMGGLHLFNATDQTLGWTTDRLREIGVKHLMAGHCTGIEPLFRLRTGLNLTRQTAVVGAVGSQFVLGEGIRATAIAM
ncbi:MAG TPA: MBL fold metallo-hydrolase [Gemmatimonadetes bacterium]|nr:MBL fold metallo-hydrolase [Gemmatimonadota bacterium]|tara:strand:- start:319 stop:1305 length:987 start_codon:yes stop_codon:yes gene_type:complete